MREGREPVRNVARGRGKWEVPASAFSVRSWYGNPYRCQPPVPRVERIWQIQDAAP